MIWALLLISTFTLDVEGQCPSRAAVEMWLSAETQALEGAQLSVRERSAFLDVRLLSDGDVLASRSLPASLGCARLASATAMLAMVWTMELSLLRRDKDASSTPVPSSRTVTSTKSRRRPAQDAPALRGMTANVNERSGPTEERRIDIFRPAVPVKKNRARGSKQSPERRDSRIRVGSLVVGAGAIGIAATLDLGLSEGSTHFLPLCLYLIGSVSLGMGIASLF